MLPILRFVAALLMTSSALEASAAALTTSMQIKAAVKLRGAEAVVDTLSSTHAWDALIHHISRGDSGWISLAPELATGADAGAFEALGLALADALPRKPEAVLAALGLADGPVLGFSEVCSVPFIVKSDAFLPGYR